MNIFYKYVYINTFIGTMISSSEDNFNKNIFRNFLFWKLILLFHVFVIISAKLQHILK